MIGRAWTRSEIDRLVETFMEGGDLAALGGDLDRTHEAVLAKAGRLRLRRPSGAEVRREGLAVTRA